MRLEPWACFGGVELINGHRTMSYLRTRGGCEFDVPTTCEGGDCCCLCETFGAPVFDVPESDPAPWFDSGRPDSTDFLGIMAFPEFSSVIQRQVQNLVSDGAAVGRLRTGPRTVSFDGMMFSASARGMRWGEQWMTEVLSGSACKDDCAPDLLELLPACPVADPPPTGGGGEDGGGLALAYGEAFYGEISYGADDFTPDGPFGPDGPDLTAPWLRQLLKVGIVDGPLFTPFEDTCKVQRVSFQLLSGVPYLYSRGATVLESTLDGSEGCAFLLTNEWERRASRITIEQPIGSGAGATIAVRATPTSGVGCPDDGGSPCVEFSVSVLPGRTIVIDSRDRTAIEYTAQTEQVASALQRLTFEGAFRFIDLEPCAGLCICLDHTGDPSNVTVDSFAREF